MCRVQAELRAAEKAKQLRQEREKESVKFEGTWAESDSDEEAKPEAQKDVKADGNEA